MEATAVLSTKGLVYENIDPSKITIRTLKGRDEKLLAELNLDNVEKKYLALLKNVITGIDPSELTLGDRAGFLLWLRANSYSTIVNVDLICESCYQKISLPIDLTSIEFKELPNNFKEPYEITLSDGSTLKLRLFRVKDEIKIADWEKKTGVAEAYIYRWALSIVDDRDIPTRMAWLENLESKDLVLIREFHERFIHGPELDKIKYSCPKCGSDEGVMTMPFRPDFLIPTSGQTK